MCWCRAEVYALDLSLGAGSGPLDSCGSSPDQTLCGGIRTVDRRTQLIRTQSQVAQLIESAPCKDWQLDKYDTECAGDNVTRPGPHLTCHFRPDNATRDSVLKTPTLSPLTPMLCLYIF